MNQRAFLTIYGECRIGVAQDGISKQGRILYDIIVSGHCIEFDGECNRMMLETSYLAVTGSERILSALDQA